MGNYRKAMNGLPAMTSMPVLDILSRRVYPVEALGRTRGGPGRNCTGDRSRAKFIAAAPARHRDGGSNAIASSAPYPFAAASGPTRIRLDEYSSSSLDLRELWRHRELLYFLAWR